MSASARASGDSNQSLAITPTDEIDLMSTQPNHGHPFPTTSTSHAVPLRREALMDHDPDQDGGFDDLQHKMYSNIDFFSHFGLQPEQQHALSTQSAGPTQNSHGQGQGQDSIFAPGFPTLANLGLMGIQQPPSPPGSAISSAAGTTAATFSHNGSMDKDKAPPNPEQCACLNDQLRAIQQLDDDHFRITTLSLDQVLQLQKMLMAQCNNSLRCSSCQPLPTVHSVLVIICDRLTEMFECIHKRLKRLHQHLADNEHATVQEQGESEGHADYPAQLFCGSTGEIAGMATCNTALFKPAFQDSYSHMEQIHMMKGLLSMQVKGFQDLLVRVRSPIQAWGSQARLSKVASLLSRMERAGANIDDVLQTILDETM
ncbi:uncharacterized protein PG998_002312 [Apiospora kogelbergensis]|uniref:uncharacterized protein n=1 Tax=Apiospora kogelbergensis TaxID=1337665 RepID=UPI00312D94D7